MENQISIRQQAARRKLYAVLPLLALPFLTAIYWLWVVRPARASVPTRQVGGLLMNVPEAMLGKEKALNKLSFYRQAEIDSAKLEDQIRKDPYRDDVEERGELFQTGQLEGLQGRLAGSRHPVTGKAADFELNYRQKQVYGRLRELDQALSKAAEPGFSEQNRAGAPGAGEAEAPPADLTETNRLRERLVDEDFDQALPVTPDPEIDQINGVLDKILTIQNPSRNPASETTAPERPFLNVVASDDQLVPSLLEAADSRDSAKLNASRSDQRSESGFFSLEQPGALTAQNAITAEVGQTQTLLSGQVIELILTQDVFISGSIVPKGSLVYGKVSVNNQRLMAQVESIRYKSAILPVKLMMYDLDGMAGIHIPDDVSRQVARQSMGQQVQGVDLGVLEGSSLAGQAASAGIQTARTFLGKKTRLVQITVRAGYRVLLLGDDPGI